MNLHIHALSGVFFIQPFRVLKNLLEVWFFTFLRFLVSWMRTSVKLYPLSVAIFNITDWDGIFSFWSFSCLFCFDFTRFYVWRTLLFARWFKFDEKVPSITDKVIYGSIAIKFGNFSIQNDYLAKINPKKWCWSEYRHRCYYGRIITPQQSF